MVEAKRFFDPVVEQKLEGEEGTVPDTDRMESPCPCKQCPSACLPFQPPRQPRWGREREFLCCGYDAWRRMEQIKRARAHVRRAGYKRKLETICNASAEKVDAAIACVGDNGTLRNVLRAPGVDSALKEALAELQIFTSDVVGTDGARAKLRHEQNGYTLMFGQAAGFSLGGGSQERSGPH